LRLSSSGVSWRVEICGWGGATARRLPRLAVVFALLISQWLLAGHMVADAGELDLIVESVGRSFFWALLFGLMYLALEPYVRRRWPDGLISWNRLLAGRFRDPLVGRVLLVGAVTGARGGDPAVAGAPAWFDVTGMTPQPPRNVSGTATLSSVIDQSVFGLMFGVVQLFVILSSASWFDAGEPRWPSGDSCSCSFGFRRKTSPWSCPSRSSRRSSSSPRCSDSAFSRSSLPGSSTSCWRASP
jgi:hypothetical protein